ncbi:hypothetical protein [Pseudooceanicola nanhaiensis]|uniref:hypothetical protein n=1 Tax=Pseudooceanicola nanhaiensis TaxID=375761 RepID=UPI001CD7BD44|nr:hypothetical protein [Pseudooceanicola nanhaiensis]MCA0921788.1 hypothetical protein [Pseudooceanicola nanhaiensis]
MADILRPLVDLTAKLRAPALLVTAAMALTGCLTLPEDTDGAPQVGFLSSSETRPRALMQEAGMASGVVKVKPPVGYCIDEKSFRASRNGGFALVASCRVLSAGTQGTSVAPVVMTVTALPKAANVPMPTTEDLAASFAPAKALWSGETTGLHIVQLAAGGDQAVPGADPRHWRAMMLMNNYLIGLALYGPQDSDVVISGGRDLLTALAAGIRNASPTPEALAERTGAPAASPAEAEETAEKRAAVSEALPDPVAAATAKGASASFAGTGASQRRGRRQILDLSR